MHFLHLSTLLTLAFSLGGVVEGKCCGAGVGVSCWEVPGRRPGQTKRLCNRYQCDDGFVHGEYQCCGKGKCNVFCCNCDSVNGQICRAAKTLRAREDSFLLESREALAAKDEEMFRTANADGSGNMTLDEFFAYFEVEAPNPELEAKFNKFDRNGDGYLQVDEMRLE